LRAPQHGVCPPATDHLCGDLQPSILDHRGPVRGVRGWGAAPDRPPRALGCRLPGVSHVARAPR